MTLDIYADLFDEDLDDQRPAGRGDSSCCGRTADGFEVLAWAGYADLLKCVGANGTRTRC
jgi:hypothetical protein